MDLNLVTDTTTRLVVQTSPDQAGAWALATGVCGVVALAALVLWRRSRALAIGVLAVSGGLYLWTAASLLRSGGVVDEFTLDRAANQFVTDSFYPRNHRFAEHPIVRPLTSIAHAELAETRNGATIVVTLRSGDRIYPLGHVARQRGNQDQVVGRIERLIALPSP